MSGESIRTTSIGHAGLRVGDVGLRLLMAPWLSERSAFQAAWHQFPSYAHLDRPALTDLRDAFVEHFRRLGEMSPYFLERIDMTVCFELSGEVEDCCPGHNLEFDLAAGACLNARCDPLVSRRLAVAAHTTTACSPHPGGV